MTTLRTVFAALRTGKVGINATRGTRQESVGRSTRIFLNRAVREKAALKIVVAIVVCPSS